MHLPTLFLVLRYSLCAFCSPLFLEKGTEGEADYRAGDREGVDEGSGDKITRVTTKNERELKVDVDEMLS
jgi:hypothetical protein